MMLGHIDRELAITLADIIDRGGNVRATIKKITGGPPYNYGILINISTDESVPVTSPPQDDPDDDADDEYIRPDKFKVITSSVKLDINWDDLLFSRRMYYKIKYGLDDDRITVPEPDYYKLYKNETNFVSRFFKFNFNAFVSERETARSKANNQIREYNDILSVKAAEYDTVFSELDFELYKERYYIEEFGKYYDLIYTTEDEINRRIASKYVTTYENLIYNRLLNKVFMIRQPKLLGFNLDFLLFNIKKNKVWALEVDGGIHGRSFVYEKDRECERILLQKGISIIRVRNDYIGHDIDNALSSIISVVS